MEHALERAGFKLVFYATNGMDIADIISMYEAERNHATTFLTTWKEELQAMIDQADCANSMRVIARK